MPTNNTRLRIGPFIFLATFFLYVLASPGNLPGDTEVRWSVARQFVRNGGLGIEDSLNTNYYAVGLDGKRYCFWGPGQSVLLIPLAAASLVLEKAFHVSPNTADLGAQFAASSILFPAIGAAAVLALHQLVLLLKFRRRTAFLSAMALAVGSMFFHSSSICAHEQTQVALLLLLAVMCVVKNQRRPSFLHAWLAAVCFGIALTFRLTALVAFAPLLMVAALDEAIRSPQKLCTFAKWFLAAILGAGVFILVLGWFNYSRFGNPFETGYALSVARWFGGHKLFEANPLYSLPAMLFSPGKSIFLYNPILLLLPLAFAGFWRRNKALAIGIVLAIAGNFVFYSCFTGWAGDYAWSIRYQVAVMPLLILPLAQLFESMSRRIVIVATGVIFALSILIQLASVVYNFNLEFVQNPNHGLIPDSYVWDPSQSHLVKRFENIARHIAGKRDFSSAPVLNEEPFIFKRNVSPESVRRAYEVNFFPFKAYAGSGSRSLFQMLLRGWVLCFAAFCASAVLLYRRATCPSAPG